MNSLPSTESASGVVSVSRASRRRIARPNRWIHVAGRSLGAGGVALGFPLADPIIGLLITVAILAVLRSAVREVFRRLHGRRGPRPGRRRRSGASRRTRCHRGPQREDAPDRTAGTPTPVATSNPATTLNDAHRIADEAKHTLTDAVPKLSSARVHAYPRTAGPISEMRERGSVLSAVRRSSSDNRRHPPTSPTS